MVNDVLKWGSYKTDIMQKFKLVDYKVICVTSKSLFTLILLKGQSQADTSKPDVWAWKYLTTVRRKQKGTELTNTVG